MASNCRPVAVIKRPRRYVTAVFKLTLRLVKKVADGYQASQSALVGPRCRSANNPLVTLVYAQKTRKRLSCHDLCGCPNYSENELKMQLDNEIEKSKRLVRTDAYQMSIGEIVSMYKDGELIINPDFQRLFRWEQSQKSKLLESILLGIPLPPIFVFETQASKWELIDGLQRISTILEFMGLLKLDGKLLNPSILEATKYLRSLRNSVWQESTEIDIPVSDQNALSSSQQLAIRRSRLGVEILKRPSDDNTNMTCFSA